MNKSEEIIAIDVKNLSKSYGNLKAVDNINFQVPKNEIFGFLGPNGAGKTTTTRMLTGVFPPDSGDISVCGFDIINNTLQAKMKMGVVPELANAYMDLTAIENILFMAQMYGITGKKVKSKAKNLLDTFGLIERKDNKIKQFSKGMKQRVIICMALINEPEILFLDEPTSGLDVQSRRLIRKEIKRLNKEGTSVFLTTHNINEANQLCDRIAIMNKGKIAAIDSPENLKNEFKKSQSVEVSFKNKKIPDLKNLDSVNHVEKRGDKYKLYTSDPSLVVEEIIEIIKDKDIKINSIRTIGPELEEVFVSLTGGEGK